MSGVDLTPVITTVLAVLVGPGLIWLGRLAWKTYQERRAQAKADAAAGTPTARKRAEMDLVELAQALAERAVAQADQRQTIAAQDAADARADARESRAEVARLRGEKDQDQAERGELRDMVDLLSRQLAQATAHIRDLEPVLRAAGIPVPAWPPDPDAQDPVMSHDRRHHDTQVDGPDRRRAQRPNQEASHG